MFTSAKLSPTRSARGFFAATILALAMPQPLSAGLPEQTRLAPLTTQSRIALEFLARLDRGAVAQAHALLEPAVQRTYPAARLAGVAKGRSRGAVRRVTSEGAAQFDKGIAQARFGKPAGGSPKHIVCIVEVPRSGYGGVTYIAVTLANVVNLGWRISDFQITSQPSGICRA